LVRSEELVVADSVGGLAAVGALYARDWRLVRRLAGASVRLPGAVVDDACQTAWVRLVARRDRVGRETAVAWLTRTAIREAYRLYERECRDLSLEDMVDDNGELPELAAGQAVDEVVEHRSRLDQLRTLNERQRRLVWLQGLGLDYTEMAQSTGTSTRTVHRQLARARSKLAVLEQPEPKRRGLGV
jgi:RNA polymerase sigma factor (sigma-70 family)